MNTNVNESIIESGVNEYCRQMLHDGQDRLIDDIIHIGVDRKRF
jgi:hypothetical protein